MAGCFSVPPKNRKIPSDCVCRSNQTGSSNIPVPGFETALSGLPRAQTRNGPEVLDFRVDGGMLMKQRFK